MEKAIFSIICTTCHARLAVRNAEHIGEVQECPKCGCLVLIDPPKGSVAVPPPLPETPKATVSKAEPAPPKADSKIPRAEPLKAKADAAKPKADAKKKPEPPKLPVKADAVPETDSVALAAAFCPVSSGVPPLPAGFTPIESPEPPPIVVGSTWYRVIHSLWGKWLLLGVSPVVGLAIVVGVAAVLSRPSNPAAVSNGTPADPTAVATPPADQTPRPKQPSTGFDRRWLPDQAKMILDFRAARLAAQPQINKLLSEADPWWRPSAGGVLRGLGLRLDQIHRLTWTSTDLSAWREQCVVVIELTAEQDAEKLLPEGEVVSLGPSPWTFRRVPKGPWPHPFAVIDSRTIVTGSEQLLRELIDRNETHFTSPPMERLLKVIPTEGDVTAMVDLGAARAAGWKLPVALLDVWPAGKSPWHIIWQSSEAVGWTLQGSDSLRSELAVVCEGETVAEKVRTAIDELVTAVKRALPRQIDSIRLSLEAGDITATTADQYKLLLDELLTALQAARWETTDGIVWTRLNWGHGPMALAEAALDSSQPIQADWLSAARSVDEANDRKLLKGLAGYAKAEGRYPPGAAGGALMPPETRLSWIATLLPYYGHADWHRRLEFGYSWNNAENQPITRQVLPEVVNPVFGPKMTEAGFPMTNYVGVAGVGEDAGRLSEKDPRAGMFGYSRTTRPEEIAKGAANTIAILGVTDKCGAWAAGGHATVRPLTKKPYINGPDGFGSGQPDGMIAGMADGSVRFLAKDTDPQVIEQLATIHGPASGELAKAEVKPVEPVVKPEPPKPEPKAKKAVVEPVKPKPEPRQPEVAVVAQLANPIPQIDLPGMPLSHVVELLTTIGGVPISFDPDAMEELDVTLSDPVTIKLAETTVGKALDAILAERKLAYVIDHGQVLITSPAEHRESLQKKRYTISDLVSSDARSIGELTELIERVITPDSWQRSGGRGTIESGDGVLVVNQTPSVHRRILVFCEKLRIARGKLPRSRVNVERFALSTRTDRAKAILDRPVTATFREATPLSEILAHLKKTTGAAILIDRPALSAAGTSDDVKATLRADKQPLGLALRQLLGPLRLAWRVVDGDVIQVTTAKAAEARLELEFYKVGSQLGKGTPDALVEHLKSRLPGASWSEAGGPGVIYFDQVSKCLIVLQSQPVQIALEALLAEKPR